ncbi:hypothetical protein [Aliiruegeria lutimaris]|uniref:Calcineurin-like phosphoesterase superfamily domain-containing protein n=1 Tax=Aliiruegeria lutimaris TaxID=571298 RepID=A0A1G8T7P6_9RHOB|nr:hypothetical protein [Aliiruegeria lutimaris]SDJ37586.1 hypothetical protein SAMN04488026_101666 [Aliiruegeria lutimaris]
MPGRASAQLPDLAQPEDQHARRLWSGQYWSLSKWTKQQVTQPVIFIGRCEEVLADDARRGGYDDVICGHVHHANICQIDDITYVNTGDWVKNCTAVVDDADGARGSSTGRHTSRANGCRPENLPAKGHENAGNSLLHETSEQRIRMTRADMITDQIHDAVNQNAAPSWDGLMERAFGQLFRGLVHAQIWEDLVVGMAALRTRVSAIRRACRNR